MTDNLILYELQKIHEALTTTKEEHTLNFSLFLMNLCLIQQS